MAFSEENFFFSALLFLYLACPLTVLSLQFLSAPYGRHSRPGWGPTLPSPIAWFLMESPTLFLSLPLFPLGRHRSHPLAIAPISLFLLHYVHRTLIYPLRLSNKKVSRYPLTIALIGFTFNLLNTYLQTRSASHYTDYPPEATLFHYLRFIVGFAIFVYGMRVNIVSDAALVKLKKESGGAYRIPRGGWFELVASPNYTGEAMEWLGFTVAAWSPAALGFFLYTCSNLGPRAKSHLEWYRQKFGAEYPAERKAFVPFIY